MKYLSFCEHADVGSGIRGIAIVAVGEDGAVEKGQIVADGVVQLHLEDKMSIFEINNMVKHISNIV